MAKTDFLSWDTTAANNTDIDSIGIQGSNSVSNFDNAFRTIMAQLRRDIDGRVVYASKSGNYTALASDNNAVHRYTAAATVTLTAAATLATNWHYTVIADGGNVTIDPNASETINGQTTLAVPNGSSCEIICNGSNFFTIAKPVMWEALGKYTLSAASSLSVTDLSLYRVLRITGSLLPSAATVGLFIRSSTNNGSSYDSGAADYTNQTLVGAGGSAAAANTTDSGLAITKQTLTAISFETILFNFNASGNNMHANSKVYTNLSAGGVSTESNGAQRTSGTARNAFQLFPSGVVTLTGALTVEGIRG